MKKKLALILGGAVLLFGGMSLGAAASSQLQEIKAFLNGGIKVRVDGDIAQLKDTNGKAVLPITYNGTTYLPVRAVADVLGVPVKYDAQTNEVLLGEQSEGVPIKQEDYNNTLYSKDPSDTTLQGHDYKEVLYSAPGMNMDYTAINPNGKYMKLYLQFAAIDKEVEHVEIIDQDKNALLKKVEGITPESGMQTIEVDITGVKNISINVKKDKDGGYMIPLTTSYYK
ncbi:stalk domain-containing protein [Paenibacillus lentus]|uniref:stalk domain-containing protein n=1 Tax=Paenibacillus lentus TaxID=1338368 RepID=UPI00364DEAA7